MFNPWSLIDKQRLSYFLMPAQAARARDYYYYNFFFCFTKQ